MQLSIKEIWICSPQFVSLAREFVASLNIKVHDVSSMPQDVVRRKIRESMMVCSVVMIDGELPDELMRVIGEAEGPSTLLAWGWSIKSRPGLNDWTMEDLKLSHQRAGGVTDGKFTVKIGTRGMNPKPKWVHQQKRPSQDLRAVLKMGVTGRFVDAKEKVGSMLPKATSAVVKIRPTLVAAYGLMAYGKGAKQWSDVRTVFGGKYMVDRQLLPKEKMAALDVPEKLADMAESSGMSAEILEHAFPIKVLQAAATVFIAGKRKASPRHGGTKRRKDTGKQRSRDKRQRPNTPETIPRSEDVAPEVTEEPESEPQRQEPTQEKMPEKDANERNLKAVKHDDSPVPTEMWDNRTIDGVTTFDKSRKTWAKDFLTVREWLMARWRRKLWVDFRKWANDKSQGRNGIASLEPKWREAARDALERADGATWWEWKAGSSPFFWAWPEDFQDTVAHGLNLWVRGIIEPWKRAQKKSKYPGAAVKVVAKLMDIRKKGYIGPGAIESLIAYFDVPKGESDIRMVYDGTKSGLNDMLFAPWFPLPTVETMLRSVVPGTYMADNDVGEMFLNFVLHEDIRRLCGIDLTVYFEEEAREKGLTKLWERWNRCAMGLRTSPYQAVQGILRAQEVIMGDRKCERNVFRWENVEFNLPGTSGYVPGRPWVCKIRSDGTIAADLFIYVDDLRITAPTEQDCWNASQRVSSVLASLGLQDAARKRRAPSWEPGAWAGSVVCTNHEGVFVMVSQEKWDKTRLVIRWIRELVRTGTVMDYKTLESYRGFLIYVTRTYPAMVPYLKGIHATLNMWRGFRDRDGWKLQEEAVSDQLEDFDSEKMGMSAVDVDPTEANAPKEVMGVPRLRLDIEALFELTRGEVPPKRLARLMKVGNVIYGFGDASGAGYGASIEIDGKIYWRKGSWKHSIAKESSNYRELRNLVETLEEAYELGDLKGCEMFMFTDNSVAERAYFRGTSSSEKLHELVLRLRKLEMRGECRIYLVHVSGKRMVWQGTDGLSRDDFNAGVMMGEPMSSFIPLHLSAIEREAGITEWVKSWASNLPGGLHFLEPEGWLDKHERATYVWTPPPAAASTAVEWLATSIHKRPYSSHIVIVPRLMTAWWFRTMSKACDFSFVIPTGCDIWKTHQFEPLLVGIYLPLSRDAPWRHRGTPRLDRVHKSLSEVWKSSFERTRVILRELLEQTWKLAPV